MSILDSIRGAVYGKVLEDVIVPGFVDSVGEEIEQFHPMWEQVYFRFGNSFLLCSVVPEGCNLGVRVVDHIARDDRIDEDDRFCICSIRELVMKFTHGDCYVVSLRMFVNRQSNLAEGIGKCLAMEIICPELGEGRDYIFLDPVSPSGIMIGKEQDLREWVDAHLGEGGDFQERTL
jgi:hypothetical protein